MNELFLIVYKQFQGLKRFFLSWMWYRYFWSITFSTSDKMTLSWHLRYVMKCSLFDRYQHCGVTFCPFRLEDECTGYTNMLVGTALPNGSMSQLRRLFSWRLSLWQIFLNKDLAPVITVSLTFLLWTLFLGNLTWIEI